MTEGKKSLSDGSIFAGHCVNAMNKDVCHFIGRVWSSEQHSRSKHVKKMPDLDNLIVHCIANDLINRRMMGNQRGLGEEPPVQQPSGYKGVGGSGVAGGGGRDQ